MKHHKYGLILGVIVACCAFALELSAAPTIHWNTLPNRQQNGYGNWYQGPQAVGTDCVIVKVDVASGPTGSFSAFSWKGSGGGNATLYSDANYAQSPASQGVQIFRAVAEDGAGNKSPTIYWIVKTFASGTGTAPLVNSRSHNYTIGYGDLPVKGSGARLYPDLDDGGRNAELLADVILSLADNGTTGKVLEFDPNVYEFSLYNGQTWGFDGTANLTLRSSADGQATLKWHHSSGSTDPHAHSLLSFAGDCANITIDNLTFDTSYTVRDTDGSHLKIWGHNMTVENCHFTHAPGYAVVTLASFLSGSPTIPHDVHFDANTFTNNFSDGIHIQAGNSIYIVGNVISGTGDDAIAVINDNYFNNTEAAYHSLSSDVHILSNYVEYSGWRGIVLQSAKDGEVDANEINYTAQHGLEISRLAGASNVADYPRRIAITNNAIWHAGWTPAHPNQSLGDSGKYYHAAHGVYLYYFNNAVSGETSTVLYCTNNAVRYHSGDSVNANQSADLRIGNSSYISDANQPLTLGGTQQWADGSYSGVSFNLSGNTNVSSYPY